MTSRRTTKRLVLLFEQELRAFDAGGDGPLPPKKTGPRVSRELDDEVVEFAAETRTSGGTPEQMLVELKTALSTVAPEVPTSQRNALVASLTGRAIDAFFGSSKKKE